MLIALTIACMFLPIATFTENSAGALAGDIAKQQDKLDRAQAKLDRDTKSGKDARSRKDPEAGGQRAGQEKLDALIAQQEAAGQRKRAGLIYSLLPGKLPAELELDSQVINNYKLYEANFPGFYAVNWAILAPAGLPPSC